ncbi:MAG TPA: FHA domain-containing protein, partial [Gemmatimonadaceae bacterium]|nr:FHA domain-containing protein [Gemmatimonadaceae bacterium]
MPVIQLHDQQHPLKQGLTRLGAGPGVDVQVSGDASVGVQAVLELGGGDQAVIRRAGDEAAVKVNGVPLGAEPTPLIHGDKVEIAGVELLFSDDKKAGATQYVSAAEIAAIAAKRSGPARATAATGGRLVSLVDGKEYAIPGAGITFGRDAGSDVVVAQNEVSRRHAQIAPAENGYVLTDLSTNGVFVNGEKVEGTKLLARADVIRVGSEEFRFYADVAPVVKPQAPAA